MGFCPGREVRELKEGFCKVPGNEHRVGVLKKTLDGRWTHDREGTEKCVRPLQDKHKRKCQLQETSSFKAG